MDTVKRIGLCQNMPKIYERIALEEYYKYYQKQMHEKPIFYKDVHYSMNQSKLSTRDLLDQILFSAIITIGNHDKNYSFALALGDADELQGIMRFTKDLNSNQIIIYDIIFTNYPNALEKLEILNSFVAHINEHNISFDGFIQDDVIARYFSSLGFSLNNGENESTLCRR